MDTKRCSSNLHHTLCLRTHSLVSIANPSKRSRVSGGVKQGRYAMMVCSSRGGSLYEISKASFKTPQKETSGDLELGMQFSCDDRLNCDGFSLHLSLGLHNLSYLQKQYV